MKFGVESNQDRKNAASNNLDCVRVQLWDVAGDQTGDRQAALLCDGADAVFIFYDITSASTYRQAREWLTRITSMPQEDDAGARFDGLIVVVGTKSTYGCLSHLIALTHPFGRRPGALACGARRRPRATVV